MATPYARIEVYQGRDWWYAYLQTDFHAMKLIAGRRTRRAIMARVRAWARRLGNIPVRVVTDRKWPC